MQHTPTIVRLDLNENPFGPSPLALEAMQAALEASHFYPENSARGLRDKLAQIHQIERRQIIVAGGLTDLLGVIARTFLAPGQKAITSEKSFIAYRTATENAGGRLVQVATREDGFDLPSLARAIDRDTRIVFLANPNNPTGTVVTPREIEQFLGEVPSHVITVLDEAYYDYAQHFAALRGVEYSRSLDYVRRGRNVIVLRTFSKAHGLAGMRVGYGIASAELTAKIRSHRTIYNVSSVAQAGALAALDDTGHVRRAVENNAHEAEPLRDALCKLGYSIPIPWGNFLYCELRENSLAIAGRLEQEGVAVRPLHEYGAPNAIRITIGKPDQNAVLLSAFRKVMHR